MFKQHWIQELITFYDKKCIKHLKIPGVLLPHPTYSITQLFMLGVRYFRINKLEDCIIIINYALKFQELIFIDFENIDPKLVIEFVRYDKNMTKYILQQKNINNFEYQDVIVTSLLKNDKYIIPIHTNFFRVYDTKFSEELMNISPFKSFKQKSNIYIIKDKENIEEIILMNI